MSAVASQLDPSTTPAVLQPTGGKPAKARWSGRERRVTVLLVMVALVSLADLVLTLTYLRNGGMSEGNPIARWVMSIGNPWMLATWKLGMLCFTCGVLFAYKKRISAEIASWVCCLAMAWLTFQWHGYVRDIAIEMRENPQLTEVSTWVAFDRN